MMYIVFGSVRQITIGPASVIALLTFNYINQALPTTAVVLCFVSGIVELVCGLFRLGTRHKPLLYPDVVRFDDSICIYGAYEFHPLVGQGEKTANFRFPFTSSVVSDADPFTC